MNDICGIERVVPQGRCRNANRGVVAPVLLRPYGANMRTFLVALSPSGRCPGLFCCAPTGQICEHFSSHCLPQGVALGWFVAPLRGKYTNISRGIVPPPGRCPGLFCCAPTGHSVAFRSCAPSACHGDRLKPVCGRLSTRGSRRLGRPVSGSCDSSEPRRA
jgi:hypothetical protein